MSSLSPAASGLARGITHQKTGRGKRRGGIGKPAERLARPGQVITDASGPRRSGPQPAICALDPAHRPFAHDAAKHQTAQLLDIHPRRTDPRPRDAVAYERSSAFAYPAEGRAVKRNLTIMNVFLDLSVFTSQSPIQPVQLELRLTVSGIAAK
ncbi:MAG TPA: hypothetical protein VM325_14270 [Alphaproteobacteria bacterium]|nr:hypothetical protein [Alphaproteobacteria bacterium]